MKRYYQGEDIPFSIDFFSEFQNVQSFSEFTEIRAYAYTDGCLIQKFSTSGKNGYSTAILSTNELSGIIASEYTSLFAPGAILIEIMGMKANSDLRYDIGKITIGCLNKSIIKEEKLDGEIIVEMTVNPTSVLFESAADMKSISVTVINAVDTGYTVSGLPSWLSISNQTTSGFDLVVTANPTEGMRSVDITVTAKADDSVSQIMDVQQSGSWLSEFIFDVETTSANVTPARIVNMGAIAEGEALIDWGDGSELERLAVPESEQISFVNQQSGHTEYIYVGTDFTHTYASAGSRTVTIKTRQGVNAFRFSTLPNGSQVNDYGATYEPNPYITTIRKVKSDSLTSIYKMFAGVIYGNFISGFQLETPNIIEVSFAFEGFGSKGVGYPGYNYSYTTSDTMRFPAGIYGLFTKGNQITSANRTFFMSGFERIEPTMLSFGTGLTSVFECFRQMRNVGANWVAKQTALYGGMANNAAELDEFVDSAIFQAHPNINNFTGAFNAINDYYGNVPSWYSYKWRLKQDLFKNNVANNLVLDWMFNKATRAIIQEDFFHYISQRIKRMNACFWNFGDGSPRVAAYNGYSCIGGYRGNRLDSYDNVTTPHTTKGLFPDASYPNLVSMVAAFGYGGSLDVNQGFHTLLDSPTGGSGWNTYYDTDFAFSSVGLAVGTDSSIIDNMASLNIAKFLAKFPNVTPTSGINPMDEAGTKIDGAAWNFASYTAQDKNGNPKSNDLGAFSVRPSVIQNVIVN